MSFDAAQNTWLPYVKQFTNPAAGAEIDATFDNQYLYRIFYVSFQLQTDATVISRRVSLAITGSTGQLLMRSPSAAIQAASLTVRYTGMNFNTAPPALTGVWAGIQFPPTPILPGAITRVATITEAIQAGDQFSDIWLTGERLPILQTTIP